MIRILIVDDEVRIVDVLEKFLKNAGYSVIATNTGSRALGYLKSKITEIDLIIADLKMPKISGIDILKEAKEMDIPVIIMTGKLINDSLEILENFGYDPREVIYKPIAFNLLSELIRKKLQISPE